MGFDVIIIGSGFGGAITGGRLAEAGYKVLILERGRRWDKHSYPRKPDDPWVWDQACPEHKNGWLDLRVFPNMTVAQGAGVGGGSLIYANISCEAPPRTFERGWPPELTYAELKPYYDRVARTMNVQRVPDNQWTARMKLVKEAAGKTGHAGRFKQLELAVSFDPEWTYELPGDPHDPTRSKKFINAQGKEQGTCVHLGNCDIGCDVHAKNTLDLNYIALAENHGADVRPLHLVTAIAPLDRGGYRVSFDRLVNGARIAGEEQALRVIVAAGSIGSTELLLRCKYDARTLSAISDRLGHNWSSNGDFLTPAEHLGRAVDPTRGPTIASAIDFLDGSEEGASFWVQDGGLPPLTKDLLARKSGHTTGHPRADPLLASLQHMLKKADPFRHLMPWFAQGVDAANGTLSLRRRWWAPWRKHLHLDWDIERSKPVIDAIVRTHKRLAAATGGIPIVPPTWSVARDLVTPHPLGGCNMATSAKDGVVDHRGEVFGCKGLYVADGAIVPEALGVNPSRTIAALAERIAAIMIDEGR